MSFSIFWKLVIFLGLAVPSLIVPVVLYFFKDWNELDRPFVITLTAISSFLVFFILGTKLFQEMEASMKAPDLENEPQKKS